MKERDFKYIYGPVSSWRLGASLGVDLLSTRSKTCNFNCVYCQVGVTQEYPRKRKVYVPTKEVIAEIKKLPAVKIDYITFSGVGEPTLAKNLGQAIRAIKKVRREPIAVLTNSALIVSESVRKDLSFADFVILKLDASFQGSFERINQPKAKMNLDKIIEGMIKFRRMFKGKLGVQIMFIGQNKDQAESLSAICKKIKPDEVQINTPLRPCRVSALTKPQIDNIRKKFITFCNICIYKTEKDKISGTSVGTIKLRRGKNR